MEEHLNKIVAGVVLGILGVIGALFKNLKNYINEGRQQRNIEKVKKMDILLDDLVRDTGAIYGHIIRYHDGGQELKLGNNWNMTVVWESVGLPCFLCTGKCSHKTQPKRLQEQWQKVPISSAWFKIVSKAYFDREKCHVTSIEQLPSIQKQIWQNASIHDFIEKFMKTQNKSFFTLGLCFCKNKELPENECSRIMLTANQIAKLI